MPRIPLPILASVTQTADTSSAAAAAAVVGCVAKERSARVRRSPVRIGRKRRWVDECCKWVPRISNHSANPHANPHLYQRLGTWVAH
jgi:hypothetical protein